MGNNQAQDSDSDDSEPFTAGHEQIVCRLFDLFFNTVPIELAIEIADEVITSGRQHGELANTPVVEAIIGLKRRSFSSDGLAKTLAINAVHIDRIYGSESISLMTDCVDALFLGNQEKRLTDLGFPFLARVLKNHNEGVSESAESSHSESLALALDSDQKFRCIVESLRSDPPTAIHALLDGTEELAAPNIRYALEQVDAKIWIKEVRSMLLDTSSESPILLDALGTITDRIAESDQQDLSAIWFEIVQKSTSERRGPLDMIMGRNIVASAILGSLASASRTDSLVKLVKSFESGPWSLPPPNLLALINKLQID